MRLEWFIPTLNRPVCLLSDVDHVPRVGEHAIIMVNNLAEDYEGLIQSPYISVKVTDVTYTYGMTRYDRQARIDVNHLWENSKDGSSDLSPEEFERRQIR